MSTHQLGFVPFLSKFETIYTFSVATTHGRVKIDSLLSRNERISCNINVTFNVTSRHFPYSVLDWDSYFRHPFVSLVDRLPSTVIISFLLAGCYVAVPHVRFLGNQITTRRRLTMFELRCEFCAKRTIS